MNRGLLVSVNRCAEDACGLVYEERVADVVGDTFGRRRRQAKNALHVHFLRKPGNLKVLWAKARSPLRDTVGLVDREQ